MSVYIFTRDADELLTRSSYLLSRPMMQHV